MIELPIILEVEAELFGSTWDVGRGIAIGDGHAGDGSGGGDAIGESSGTATCDTGVWSDAEDAAWVCGKVDLRGGVEFEIATESGLPDVVSADLEDVIAPSLADVIFELPLALEGLLRDVSVGAEAGATVTAAVATATGEGEQRRTQRAVDDVVPVLISERELVHHGGGQRGVQGEVGDLHVVVGEVARIQILEAVGLVVEAVVRLRRVRDVGGILGVDVPVGATVVARLEERSGNDGGGVGPERLRESEFREGSS